MADSSQGLQIRLIGKAGSGTTGTSRYTESLYRGLKAAGVRVTLAFPEPFPYRPVAAVLKRGGLDVNAFFATYPLRVRPDPSDIHHLTTQTAASLLMTQRFGASTVVSVLDIIPYLVRDDRALRPFGSRWESTFYRLSLQGLKRASALIAISEFTKRTLVEALRIPAGKIHVIYPQTDPNTFRPQPVPESFRERYGLTRDVQHVLYVGTNDPRKNLPALAQAIGLLRQKQRRIRLIKIGANPWALEHLKLQRVIAQLGLQDDVLFLEGIPDEDLSLFYNICDLFVLPSLYEGFGIPVVEAMACGAPVVCSKTSSLPEVAGAAARTVDPRNASALAAEIEAVLDDSRLREQMRAEGLRQAVRFCGDDAIRRVRDVYAATSTVV